MSEQNAKQQFNSVKQEIDKALAEFKKQLKGFSKKELITMVFGARMRIAELERLVKQKED